jgi:hypothetical protein
MIRKIPLFIIALIFLSCKKSTVSGINNNQCDPSVSYSTTVKIIFVAYCTASGCHDGVDLPSLSDYTVARDASAQIKDAVARGIMPKNATLTQAQKDAIVCWIQNGAKNN